ncbi:MAG: hypothetical protein R3C99_24505 [Pirellulaceae bacterium]
MAVSFELLLGCLLILNLAARWAWPIAILFFASLCVIATTLAFTGQASCDCMGRIPIEPAWIALFDGLAMIAMSAMTPVWWKPTFTAIERAKTPSKALAVILVVLALAAAGTMSLRMYSGWNPVAYRGTQRPLTLLSESIWIGVVNSGESRLFSVRIRNNGHGSVAIIGVETLGFLTLWRALPVVIAPGETVTINGTFEIVGGGSGNMVLPFQFLTDSTEQPSVRGRVSLHLKQNPNVEL